MSLTQHIVHSLRIGFFTGSRCLEAGAEQDVLPRLRIEFYCSRVWIAFAVQLYDSMLK